MRTKPAAASKKLTADELVDMRRENPAGGSGVGCAVDLNARAAAVERIVRATDHVTQHCWRRVLADSACGNGCCCSSSVAFWTRRDE
jgi:hypothetical protein